MCLRVHSAGKDYPRTVQRGDHVQWYKSRPLFACTPLSAYLAQRSFWEMYHSREGARELLSAGRTRSDSLYSWLLLSNCRASGAWHRHCRQPRFQTLTRGWIISHQSLAWGTPATAMQYLPLLLWRAKR